MEELQMKLEKEDISLEEGLQKEWLITNGLGGYAASTVLGANTRRYHGLFVAPLNPPARRYLVLSNIMLIFADNNQNDK